MPRIGVLGAVFAASGAAALTFETLWFHQAGLAFGNGVWASGLVLSAFMAGMALGSHLAARYGDRVPDAVRAYAALELAVAVFGVALVHLLPALGGLLGPIARHSGDRPALLHAVRFVVAGAALLVPATAMGATLPLLVRAASLRDSNFARVLGLLYGANTAGAVAGVLVTETVLLEAIGIRGSALVAGAVALAAAAAAFTLSRRAGSTGELVPSLPPVPADSREHPWLLAGFLSGFALLALEVVWLRLLTLFLNDTSVVFATVLAVALAGIALGSFAASHWASRSTGAERGVAWVAYGGGLLGLAGYLLYPLVLRGVLVPYQDAGTVARIAAPLVLPTSIASGALFTLIGANLARRVESNIVAVGRLGLFNTVGAGLGSLVAGFVMLPRLGMERSLFVLLCVYGAVGLLLSYSSKLGQGWRYGAAAVFMASLLTFPFGRVEEVYIKESARRWMRSEDSLVGVREGVTQTLVHVVHGLEGVPVSDQIATNAYSMTANDFLGRRYMKSFVLLPAALHPEIGRALVVGYGIGNTARAMTCLPGIREIQVVDISTEMLAESRKLRIREGADPLDDPRVHVRIEDGRFFLATTATRYDLITGEPPPPIMATVASLYTAEYFRLVHDRLNEGGIATYWLPMMNVSAETAKAIIRGFCDAFADCSLWHGSALHFMLMGTRGARGPVSEAHFGRQWADPGVRPELMAVGLERPSQLAALFVGDAAYLRALTNDVEPLTDDRPKRIFPPPATDEHSLLIEAWQDPAGARERFLGSAFVGALFPPEVRAPAAHDFELERIVDDLMSRHPKIARDTRVLHKLLRSTDLRLPVLLLLGSTPDIQAALSRLPPARQDSPRWLHHRAAGRLAERDLVGALAALEHAPPGSSPIENLAEYVAYAVRRQAAGVPSGGGGP